MKNRYTFALLLLSSCQVATTDIQGEDDDVLFRGGRASWTLTRDTDTSEDSSLLDGVERSRPVFSLDFEATRGDGESEQQLPAGEAVVFGSEFFNGPELLSVQYELTRVLVNARFGSPTWNGLSAEVFAGLEYDSMEVDVSAKDGFPTGVGSNKTTSIGPGIGAALVWEPVQMLRLSAEGRFGVGFSSEIDDIEVSCIEIGATVYPIEHAGFFVGWRKVSFEAGPGDMFESGVDLELSGPMLGLSFRF